MPIFLLIEKKNWLGKKNWAPPEKKIGPKKKLTGIFPSTPLAQHRT